METFEFEIHQINEGTFEIVWEFSKFIVEAKDHKEACLNAKPYFVASYIKYLKKRRIPISEDRFR